MDKKTRALLAEIARVEGIDINDLLFAVSEKIDILSENTTANGGQYQVYFIDHNDHDGGTPYCLRPDKKSAIEERDRLMKKLGEGTSCEYYVRSPGGYLIP